MSEQDAPVDLGDALEKIRAGKLLATELADAQRQRVARYDPMVHSFLHIAEEAEPTTACARQTTADARGPLAGIRIGIKDIFDTFDMPTTGNSRLFAHRRPAVDAAAVARLRNVGAKLAGKLAAWELAIGGTSFTLPWPPTRNPWDLNRDPGGSSTGSAAALAAGFVMGALGSDTGGSIREPAAWCGIAGLKPTLGLLDTTGTMAASPSLDHIGPMARSSRDCAIMLEVLQGAPSAHAREIASGVEGLRIGIVDLDAEGELDLQPAIADSIDATARSLADAGASLHHIRLPPLAVFSSVCTVISGAEGYTQYRDDLTDAREFFDPLTRQRLLVGAVVTTEDLRAAQRLRSRLIAETSAAMEDVDLLLMPTTRATAPLLGGFDSHGGHPSLCRPWNVTGFPALSVRAGFDANALPIGVQVIGGPYTETLVLRCGYVIEQCCEGGAVWPKLAKLAAPIPARAAPPPSDRAGLEALTRVVSTAVEIIGAY